jgi:hypothetical protein
MVKTILYPFAISEDNSVSYLKTLELAGQMDAKVVCFTTVEEEHKLDDAYLHLLALNGRYQTKVNKWQVSKIQIERAIQVGDMQSALYQYLGEKNVDVLIRQKPILRFEEALLDLCLKKNNDQPQIFSF